MYVNLDSSSMEMFLDDKEIPLFRELSKKYGEHEAFCMILDGYKPNPFSNILNGSVRS